jgi:hypothetical protein
VWPSTLIYMWNPYFGGLQAGVQDCVRVRRWALSVGAGRIRKVDPGVFGPLRGVCHRRERRRRGVSRLSLSAAPSRFSYGQPFVYKVVTYGSGAYVRGHGTWEVEGRVGRRRRGGMEGEGMVVRRGRAGAMGRCQWWVG